MKTRRARFDSRSIFPLVLSILIAFPDGPLAASAAAQVVGAVDGASASGPAGGASAAAGTNAASASAPAPLALNVQTFAAPLGASAPAFMPAASAAAPRSALAAPAASIAAAAPAPALTRAAPHEASIPPAGPAVSLAAAEGPVRGNASAPDGASSPAERGGEAGEALFDGKKPLNAGSVKILMVQHGHAPVAATLATLDSVLKTNPEAASTLKKNGVVRLVLGNRPADELVASPEFKAKYPAALGVAEDSPLKQAWGGIIGNPLLKLAAFPFKLGYRLLTGAPVGRFTLADAAALPGRIVSETRFLVRTFRDSMTKPLTSEVLGGIATKSWPLAASIGVYWMTVGLAHPFAMAGLMALSLFQETFHGIFLNTWNNFQENLSRMRGFAYQMNFNLLYMQGFGAIYRALSWSANPHKTIPPWSPFYWKDVMVMSLAGTFFGTLGFNGLNTLYSKGRLKRWQRSGIQQLRDVLFLLAGPFFATGSMHAFWALFVFQQALDLTIALIAWRAQTRTILYAVASGDSSGNDPEKLKASLSERGVTAPAAVEKLTLAPVKTEAAR